MLDTSRIYTSKNDGDFKIVEYINWCNIKIEFVDTGFIGLAQGSQISTGRVKDCLKPSVYGVGFIGDGKHSASVKGKKTKVYSTWHSMLRRCYAKASLKTHPTYSDVTTCEEWHNFQNFADWFELNYQEGLHLDKDIKIKGNKVYSPNACKFVSQNENNTESHAKHYKVTSPKGEVVNIYNMRKFCRENNLMPSHLISVINGKRPHHKQWRIA